MAMAIRIGINLSIYALSLVGGGGPIGSFLLKEDGDYLLLEDGGFIILE